MNKKSDWFPLACALLAAVGLLGLPDAPAQQAPAWWSERGVIDANSATNDFAAVAQGQVKWMATNAFNEMNEQLVGGAGTAVCAAVSGFASSNNYLPANLGQLKALARPFYERLMAVGYTSNYPWTSPATDDVDYALANVGQLKSLFCLDFVDADGDGLPDWWERYRFGSTTNENGAGDADGDGYSNLDEYTNDPSTDPGDPMSHPWGALYVSTNGAANGVGSYADPYPSIAMGIAQASDGMRVLLFPGVYTGAANRDLDVAGKSIGIEGLCGASQTIIDCESSGRGFYFHSGETGTVVRGLTIRNGAPADGLGGAIRTVFASPLIESCVIEDCMASAGGAIHCEGGSPRIVRCSLIANRAGSGAALYCDGLSTEAVLCGSLVKANIASNSGIVVCDGSAPAIVNDTLVGNEAGYGGALQCNSQSDPTVANSIIAFNSAGVRCESGCSPEVLNNCVYDNASYDYSGVENQTGDNGNISEDPLLASTVYGDAHIQSNSPCRDAGSDVQVSGLTLDLDGEPRVQGASVDMGAYESAGNFLSENPRVIRVTTTGSDANDGSTWLLAKRTVQAAVNSSANGHDGVEVWVAMGMYQEHITVTSLHVAVYGGFDGSETARTQRDWSGHPTILDGAAAGQVLLFLGTGSRANILDGFTVRNGVVVGVGGGIRCCEAGPVIANCLIESNRADFGGGCYIERSDAVFSNCVIRKNTATGNSSYGPLWPRSAGGGVFLFDASASILNSKITDNEAINTGYGGGVAAFHITVRDGTPSPVAAALIRGCTIASNSSDYVGGGMSFCGYNWNLPITRYAITVEDSVISCNSSHYGGGIHHWYWSTSPTFVNTLFFGNSATAEGAGAKVEYNYESGYGYWARATFLNCSFVGNTLPSDYAVKSHYSVMYMSDCVIWSNSTLGGIRTDDNQVEGPYQEVEYSCIEGGYHGVGYLHEGNIETNPAFANASCGDVHLSPWSPAVNSGSYSASAYGLSWHEGYGTDPDGVHGDESVVDMGYHYSGYTQSSDTDLDGLPDWWETLYFGDATSGVANVDSDGDGVNNLEEYRAATNPTDIWSCPPLPMLKSDGRFIVDDRTNHVVLKSINIGGWLAWEQWLLEYGPREYTNCTGLVSTNDMDEGTARELLAAHVDGAISLMATNAVRSSGTINTSSWYTAWLCPSGVTYVGSLRHGATFSYTRDFGAAPGVSNVMVAVAVPQNNIGGGIELHRDNAAGPLLGKLTFEATGPNGSPDWAYWHAFSEQPMVISNIYGVQTICFVVTNGNTSVDTCNLWRFRFLNDPTNTWQVFQKFQDNYFSTNDLDRIRSLGYNCIRLPFFYWQFEEDYAPYKYKSTCWDKLDWVISECAKRRIWCLLDLHGAAGGVNPWHSAGVQDPFRNRMWKMESYKKRTEVLWNRIAQRYASQSAVVGYDLINEPRPPVSNETRVVYSQIFSNEVLPMMTRLHQAIRSNDTAHILFLESNIMYTNMWEDAGWWPTPAQAGWTNVCYEFHVYNNIVGGWGGYDESFTTQKAVCDANVRAMTKLRDERNVPVYLGEFQPGDPQNHDYAYRRYDANGIHWSHWNFRCFGWMDSSRPNRGWTSWGLDYRSKDTTNLMPDLLSTSMSDLTNWFAQYSYTNYMTNAHLQRVVKNDTPQAGPEYCESYLNTFSSPNGEDFSQRWPWQKISGIGNSSSFKIAGRQAKLKLDEGPVVMRWRSRVEADARFRVNDATGSWFEVQACSFNVTNRVENPEAEVRLAVVRDEITNVVKQYDTRGLLVRMEYDEDAGATTVNLYMYRKTGGVNTFGDELYRTNGLAFSTNALRMHVTSNTLSVIYDGTNYFSDVHGLDINSWSDGAVAVVEAQDVAGNTQFAYLDNMRAWRDGVAPVQTYEGSFTNAPDGMMVRSWMGDAAVYLNWSLSRDTATYVANNRVMMVPADGGGNSTWLNARRDFQNDLRLDVSTGGVAEVRASIRDFTGGYAKIGLLPEYYSGFLYNDWDGTTLYLEMSRSGGNISFTVYRTSGVEGARAELPGAVSVSYDNTKDVVLQISSNKVYVYYGSTPVIANADLGVDGFPALYIDGLHPHLEYQSGAAQPQGSIMLNALKCRMLGAFAAP